VSEQISDLDALKSEKRELIDRLIQMQKQFIEHEHQHGFSGRDYWAASEGLLVNYRQEFTNTANRVVDLAHEILGSSRI
jgi:hypothetical protein